ncbi:MAG: hypothetical protein U1C51_04415 [Candidatus Izemoplasmatales bacterium]|nr:hypothetical protein [Methylobacter sp.]MDP2426994.1 hypothetical protein [Methylobacter sp.]MDP3055832.1 hypothetical protein [Methylobacter sp.]MDP3361806.1 hypothetical protein [Methylobacter sp.]MDZ4196477.1 hypothetical protein [Candidatus Izemoplasmatales bacterium]
MQDENITYPSFEKPQTTDDAFKIAHELTGQFWSSFSPARNRTSSDKKGLGGQAFLAKRVAGREWFDSQKNCYLCGQGILTPRDLLISLGRNPLEKGGFLDVEMKSGCTESDPSPDLKEKLNKYGAKIFPVEKYRKK